MSLVTGTYLEIHTYKSFPYNAWKTVSDTQKTIQEEYGPDAPTCVDAADYDTIDRVYLVNGK